MTKQQIIAELRRLGIAHRAKAPKDDLERLLADAQRKPRTLPEKVWPETRKAEDVTPARAGTKRAALLEALSYGNMIRDFDFPMRASSAIAPSSSPLAEISASPELPAAPGTGLVVAGEEAIGFIRSMGINPEDLPPFNFRS